MNLEVTTNVSVHIADLQKLSRRPTGVTISVILICAAVAVCFSFLQIEVGDWLLVLAPTLLIVFVTVLLFPRQLVLLLPFMAVISGWLIEVFGRNVRLDQALGVGLALSLVCCVMIGKTYWRRSRLDVFIYWFLICNLLSSALSDNPKASLMQVMNVSTSVLLYFVVINLVRSQREFARFITATLVAAFLAMSYGLMLFVLGVVGFELPGVNLAASTASFGIYGSMREPNIFGSYSASMLMIGLCYLSASRGLSVGRRGFLMVFCVVACLALMLSYARAAWVGAALGLTVLTLKRKAGVQLHRFLGVGIFVSLSIAMLFMSGLVPADLYSYKFSNLFNFEEGTGRYRAIDWVRGWENFVAHPILGNGTFSYSYSNEDRAVGETPGEGAWISNLTVLVLHDTGLVGMGGFIALIWAIFRATARPRGETPPTYLGYHGMAFQTSFTALIVAFQATSAFFYGFTWLLIGMIGLLEFYGDPEGSDPLHHSMPTSGKAYATERGA